jgi:hypothetical protein
MGKLAEAYAANPELAEISMRPAADFAAVMLSGGKFRRPQLFDFH